MRSRTVSKPAPSVLKAPAPISKPLRPAPSWLRPVLLILMGILLFCVLTVEVSDTDTWWHLASGRYIWQNHHLPVPDPFSFTTDMGKPVYPGELTTRHFNLTHEWGMQVIFYLLQKSTGFGGLVLFRALLMGFFCSMVGWLTARRSGSFYRGLAATWVASIFAASFAADRPFLATFVMVALTVAAFETRRGLWLLPPAFLLWANLHGGFIMGWALVSAYSAEALYHRFRGTPDPNERKIWIVSALAIFATFWNPNGWHVVEVMRYYRTSPLQISIAEWNYPAWWPPDRFNMLAAGTVVLMIWFRKKVRFVDWLLFAVLGGSAASALRNVIFIGFIGPLLFGTYLPQWKRRVPVILEYAAGVALLGFIGLTVWNGRAFQLRVAEWKFPAETADFLINHKISGRIFNTYEQGGYLMWRLWPQNQVFIDGRALNESVGADYQRMQFNADTATGKTANDLLHQYGVNTIVMNGFDAVGNLQFLVAALSDPSQKEWKLVYEDKKDVIYMREPPPGVQPLPSITALGALEGQCNYNIHHGITVKCARALGDMYLTIGDRERARGWLTVYLRFDPADPAANREMRRILLGR
jgi:hypothetical protein